jgi:hypothetical protein
MAKITLFPVLLVGGCLISGLYGMLHNQISYTVAPDYFHAFKFHQFVIPNFLHNRVGASIVGWQASWWMGVIIGVPVLLVGLVMPDPKTYLTRSLIAFAVVAATALVVGLGALAYANSAITASDLPGYWYPEGVINKAAFARAGTMHNFSYVGGFLGIITATLYLLAERIRLTKRCSGPAARAAELVVRRHLKAEQLMPKVSHRYRGTTDYARVLAELVRAAEYRGLTTYQDIAVVLGLPIQGEHLAKDIGYLLGEISEDEVSHGRPMLSAVVVGFSGRPGSGFFSLARSLGRLTGPQADEEPFWRQEVQRLYETWRRPLLRST